MEQNISIVVALVGVVLTAVFSGGVGVAIGGSIVIAKVDKLVENIHSSPVLLAQARYLYNSTPAGTKDLIKDTAELLNDVVKDQGVG